jgi:integrase
MRAGEAKRLKWTDIDLDRRVITLNSPEKDSKPRMWKVNRKTDWYVEEPSEG